MASKMPCPINILQDPKYRPTKYMHKELWEICMKLLAYWLVSPFFYIHTKNNK